MEQENPTESNKKRLSKLEKILIISVVILIISLISTVGGLFILNRTISNQNNSTTKAATVLPNQKVTEISGKSDLSSAKTNLLANGTDNTRDDETQLGKLISN